MLIIHGETLRESDRGFVAESCYFCRKVQRFRLTRIVQRFHLFFIAFFGGKTVAHKIACQECGGERYLSEVDYLDTAKDVALPVEALGRLTNPRASRSEFWQHAAAGGQEELAAHGDRLSLLAAPFKLLNRGYEWRYQAGPRADRIAQRGLLLFVGGIVAILLICTADSFDVIPPELKGAEILLRQFIGAAVFFLGIPLILYGLVTEKMRYRNEHIYRPLGVFLQPLDPSRPEVEAVLTQLKAQGLVLGRKLSVSRVRDVAGRRTKGR